MSETVETNDDDALGDDDFCFDVIDAFMQCAADNDWENTRHSADNGTLFAKYKKIVVEIDVSWQEDDSLLVLTMVQPLEQELRHEAAFYKCLNRCNMKLGTGTFGYLEELGTILWKASASFIGTPGIVAEQVTYLLGCCVCAVEQFLPELLAAESGEEAVKSGLLTSGTRVSGRA